MNWKLATDGNSGAEADIFKRCSRCQHCWLSREMFLQDPELEIIGYQANFVDLDLGTFLFNHSCGTTLAMWAKDFIDLYKGPVYATRATASEECRGFCFKKEELRPCPVQCGCAYVREVAAIIRSWPKQHSSSL